MNSLLVLSQTIVDKDSIPSIPEKGFSIKNFVPEKWKIKYKVASNLNADNLADVILVLEFKGGEYVDVSAEQANELERSKELPRLLVILFRTKTGYRLSAVSRKVIACERCGGVHGDPFDGIIIKNRTFTTKFYGGSGWRGKHNHQFKYMNNNWYLISRTDYVYSIGGYKETNFLKVDYLKHTLYQKNRSENGPISVVNLKIKPVELMKLSDFDITNDDHRWGTKEERE